MKIFMHQFKSILITFIMACHKEGNVSRRFQRSSFVSTVEEAERHIFFDLLFFDFSKAFDSVCHVILLSKLSDIGICSQLVGLGAFFKIE